MCSSIAETDRRKLEGEGKSRVRGKKVHMHPLATTATKWKYKFLCFTVSCEEILSALPALWLFRQNLCVSPVSDWEKYCTNQDKPPVFCVSVVFVRRWDQDKQGIKDRVFSGLSCQSS